VKKVRVKPSKEASLFATIFGLIMIGIGVFLVIPNLGAFGVLWTLIAVAMTGYNLFNVFSARGIATQEIDIEEGNQSESGNDEENRLERLERLKEKGLITEEEYQKKKREILARF
jgi:hypothetical protein